MENSTLVNNKSTHEVPVLDFSFSQSEPHFNADKLRTMKIGDTEYTYCLNIEDWKDKENIKVVWIPPDSLLDTTRPEFNFLAKDAKLKNEKGENDKQGKYVIVRAKDIRGVVSYGLLVPYGGLLNTSENAASELGVIHYEPEEEVKQNNGDDDSAPSGVYYKYDVDSAMKYSNKCFSQGQEVFVTRKYNGENWKAVYKDGKFNVSSRTNWKKEFTTPPQINVEDLVTKLTEDGLSREDAEVKAKDIYDKKITNFKPSRCKWWNGLSPEIMNYLKANEGNCVYGEIINTKGGYSYGLKQGEVKVKVFDILKPDGTWLNFADLLRACDVYSMDMVEVIHHYFPYNFENLRSIAEDREWNDCTKPNEGIVFGSITEAWSYRIGRHKFKIVSSKYSQKN